MQPTRRALLRAGLACGVLAALPVSARPPALRFDAVVARRRHPAGPTYPSVAEALAAAPRHGSVPFRILVTAGRWREKLVVDAPGVHLVGEGVGRTVLTFDAAAGMPGSNGEPWGTWGCASLSVRAPDFAASHLTIENAFDYIGNLGAPRFEPIGPNGAQAVALMLDAGADRSHLVDIEVLGHQDTLFVDAGRSLFERCRIAGSVDFVFGGGNAVFEDCTLHSRHRPDKPRQGYVAVPCTPAGQRYGLTFSSCRLTREPEVPDASVALGRAWRPGRTFPDGRYGDPDAVGAATYLDCWMDAHIDPVGWDAMGYTARTGERVQLQPGDARLAEHGSHGPGAHATPTRPRLSPAERVLFARSIVLARWNPAA